MSTPSALKWSKTSLSRFHAACEQKCEKLVVALILTKRSVTQMLSVEVVVDSPDEGMSSAIETQTKPERTTYI